jgi:hypothetical protein
VVLVSWVWCQRSDQVRTRLELHFQPGPDADTIPRRLEILLNFYTVPLEDGLKESPKHVRHK